jgi:hypothetical protein
MIILNGFLKYSVTNTNILTNFGMGVISVLLDRGTLY